MDFRRAGVIQRVRGWRERWRERDRDRERREKKGTRRDRGEISDRRNTLTSSTFVVFFESQEEDQSPAVVRAGLFVIVCKLWLIPHYRY